MLNGNLEMKKVWSIGIVKNFLTSGDKPGFGFIASNSYGLSGEPRECVEVYFKENAWLGGAKQPKEGDVVSFEVKEFEENRQTAFKVEPLAANRKNLLTALRQTAYCPLISARLRMARRDVRRSPLALLFRSEDIGADDWEHIKSVILEYLRCLDTSDRDNVFSKFLQDASVAERLRQLFSGIAFDPKFGDVIKTIKKAFSVQQTPEVVAAQAAFIEYLSLKNFKRQLVARLAKEGGRLVAKEIRCPDFSVIERYKEFPAEGDPVGRKVEGVIPVVGRWEDVVSGGSEGYYTFDWKFTNTNRGNLCEIGIRTDRPATKLTPKDIVDRLYDAAMRMEAGAARQISSTHDTIEKQLTEAGDDVFVYELLQNANDYPFANDDPVNVEIELGDKCLYFRHDGAAFTPKNVAAICSVNDHDKSDNPNAIGYKGIGFKTVFRYNSRVIVQTGGFRFSFDEALKEKKDGVPWRTTPKWEEKTGDAQNGAWRVQFSLFPRNRIKLGRGEAGYGRILSDFFADERALLFIPRLGRVDLILHGERKPIDRNNGGWCLHEPFVEGISEDLQEDIENQLRDIEHCRIPPKYRGMTQTQVSFACRKSGRRLIPEPEGCLYCFLPAKEARWGFKFLMNTDMIPNGSRNNIEYSISLNEDLAEISGRKFFDWISWLLTSGEYEYDSIFDLIPDFDDCLRNRGDDVQKYIRRFQKGFESKLDRMVLPTDDGSCVPASECVFDSTGVLRKFGSSFWGRLKDDRSIVSEQLWGCDSFARFVERYGDLIKINTFDFADLRNAVSSSAAFAKWIQNPVANGAFLRFLVEARELKTFKDAPIFLDNHKNIGPAAEMYFYEQGMQRADRYLEAFSKCYRCLSKDCACLDEIGNTIKDSFRGFEPRFLIENEIFSAENREFSLKMLCDVSIARKLFAFISHYKTYTITRKVLRQGFKGYYYTRQEPSVVEYFPREYLGTFPIVLEDHTELDQMLGESYAVFDATCEDADLGLVKQKWIGEGWFKVIDHRYFEGEEGERVRKLFQEKELVSQLTLRGVLRVVETRFVRQIEEAMLKQDSDLEFYDFLKSCSAAKCLNENLVKEQLSLWPVEDASGSLSRRDGLPLYYFNRELLELGAHGWFTQRPFLVLNEKYSRLKEIFDLLGAVEYDTERFGELFCKTIAHRLLLDSSDKILSFHAFMKERYPHLNDVQRVSLKSIPVTLANGGVNASAAGVYLPPQNINVSKEMDDGTIGRDIKILDQVLYDAVSDPIYWKLLGAEELDATSFLEEKLKAYLVAQNGYCSGTVARDEFSRLHRGFVETLSAEGVLSVLKNAGLDASVASVRFFSKNCEGVLYSAKDLVFPNIYSPVCDFESYCKDLHYVSEDYLDIAGAASLLKTLGVISDLTKEHVELLAEQSFCRYFWTVYLPAKPTVLETVKTWLTPETNCVLDRDGNVRKPKELYGQAICSYVDMIPGASSKLPAPVLPQSGCEHIGFKEKLTVEDALAYLLQNPDYKTRGLVLQWIAEGCNGVEKSLADSYRNDSRAVWRNGKKRPMHIKELCAIRKRQSEQARLFIQDEHVIDLTGLGVERTEESWRKVEQALDWLGVQLVNDDCLEIEPEDATKDASVIPDVAARLLVFLASRYEDEWDQEFDGKYRALLEYGFYKCSGLVVSCRDNEWLHSTHGKFMVKDKSFYFVHDWQSKYVYGDMIATLREKLLRQFSVDDLKEVLDTNGGNRGLADLILADEDRLLRNDTFMQTLKGVSPGVWQVVATKVAELERKRRSQMEPQDVETPDEVDATIAEEDLSGSSPVEETDEDPVSNAPEENRPTEPEKTKRKIGDYEVDEDEYSQLSQIFTGGDSSDDVETAKKKDESKLACLRLFNQLESQGLEPSMDGHREIEYVVRELYAGLGKTGPNIDINTGERLHVISAMGGVGYIPPRWWNKVVNNENGANVICAITGASKENCVFIRSCEDLLAHVGDNAIPVKIRGANAEERVRIATNWFSSVDVSCTAGKIYALLKLRDKTVMNTAFAKGFCSDEMSKYEETHNDDL